MRGFDLGSDAVRVHAAAPYRGPAGRALVAMKERGVVALVTPLAGVLAASVLAAREDLGDDASSRPLVLVPAPSRPSAVRARGGDVVAELARACADRLRPHCGRSVAVARCLVHARAVADQATLDADERALNLDGALRVRLLAPTVLAGRDVVIVDDVLTTGATVREAARALLAASGAARPPRVAAATIAAAGAFGAAFERESAQTVVVPGAGG